MLRILLAAYEFAILNQESISYLNYLFDSCMAWYVESMYSHRVLLLSRVSLTKCWYFRRLCRAFYTFSHHLMVYVSFLSFFFLFWNKYLFQSVVFVYTCLLIRLYWAAIYVRQVKRKRLFCRKLVNDVLPWIHLYKL